MTSSENNNTALESLFTHPSELEFARLLDYYGIPWEYEPHTFILREDDQGNVIEAFTPDFYLPEQDLYVEVTTLRQKLITKKNRKLRELRQRYPHVNVKLFNRRDFQALLVRWDMTDRYDDLIGEKALQG